MEQKYIYNFDITLGTVIEVRANNENEADEKAREKYDLISLSNMDTLSSNMTLVEVKDDKFRIGDIVKVVHTGNLYSTYSAYFDDYKLSNQIKRRYQCEYDFENSVGLPYTPIDIHNDYRVLFRGKHRQTEDMLYVIENMNNNCVYLIGEKGIELV